MAPVVVAGVPSASGILTDPPARLEIQEFVKNEKFFSLYIQALQVMDSDYLNDPTSYYQINGIHGMPFTPWNDATPDKAGDYCQHRSILFPTWHRPYTLLFEQAIQKRAVKIADKYTVDKELWVQAAIELRQPFWDWTLSNGAVPPKEIYALKRVEIITFDGTPDKVDNPFFGYNFPSEESHQSFKGDFQIWPMTLRNPKGDGLDAVSNLESLEDNLKLPVLKMRERTYKALLGLKKWQEFSTKGSSQGGKPINSLESIHDTIHVRVGWGGHMNDPAVAAFDPIFHLHHCQIDRLLSLWSAVNPNTWVSKVAGSSQDENTELLPFWNSEKTKWSSVGLKDTKRFNYTYPEFKGVNMSDPATPKYFERLIEHLFNDGPDPGLAPGASAKPQFRGASKMALEAGAELKPIVPLEPVSWTARIRCHQDEVDTSFSVLLFVGKESEIPEDSQLWSQSSKLVGCYDIFVNSHPDQCSNCRENAGLLTEGFVDLDHALRKSVKSFDESVVTPYLRNNLQWRVIKVSGEVINPPSLEIMVMSTPVAKAPGHIFPSLGESKYYENCTDGRYH